MIRHVAGPVIRAAEDTVHTLVKVILLPAGIWAALTILGVVLRFGFPAYRTQAALAAVFLGMLVTLLDWHARRSRATLAGRWAGPVTAAAAALFLAVWVRYGWSQGLAMMYVACGCAAWAAWAVLTVHGDRRDMVKTFAARAGSIGDGRLAGARLFGVRRQQGRRGAVTRAGMQLPAGQAVVTDAADLTEHIEGVFGKAPGSLVIRPDRTAADLAELISTDPDVLTREPLPWPGPSAPGLSVAEPFRLGAWQDGEIVNYRAVPIDHVLAVGETSSGKTQSFTWNMVAEGITRIDYACLAVDTAKRRQFLGPLETALHRLVLEPEDVPPFLEAVNRARLARCDHLAALGLTEWAEGCGLTFLHVVLCEVAALNDLLDRKQQAVYVDMMRNARTAGIRVDADLQLSQHTQIPVVARAQASRLVFGLEDRKDSELALSGAQKAGGARPHLWGKSVPGMAYFDSLTIPDDRVAMPMRFWWWGLDAARIAAHASEYPASARPLDEVTAAALEPPARIATVADRPVTPAPQTGAAADPVSVRPRPEPKPSQHRAQQILREIIEDWRDQGRTTFTAGDVTTHPRFAETGRIRSWVYGDDGPLDRLEGERLIALYEHRPMKRWEIRPAVLEGRREEDGYEEDQED